MKSILTVLIALLPLLAFGQDYPTFQELSSTISKLSQNVAVTSKSIGKSANGKDIWCLTLGKGDVANHPAIAIVSGLDGHTIHGASVAMGIAESLSKEEELLENTTFYIIPVANPDAYHHYFSNLKYVAHGNGASVDNDRDGRLNEDGFEDLNGDGLITMMRVEDPTGEWRLHELDSRFLVKADISKGEKGTHKLFTEGKDNDGDGDYNEDGDWGININKNFTFQHPTFKDDAGDFATSETETRAIIDFLFDAWNVHTVISIDQENNLAHPWKYNRQGATTRLVSSIQKDDETVAKQLAALYKKSIKQNLKEAPKYSHSGGDFPHWAYFHYGRVSLSTPAFWTPEAEQDTAKDAKKLDLKNSEINLVAWYEQQNLPSPMVAWSSIDHPDFEGRKVEVGGIKPYAATVMPISKLEEVTEQHTGFVKEVAALLPRIQFENVEVIKLDKNLYRITAHVYNNGILPTHTDIGQRTRWVRKPYAQLDLNDNQLVSGRAYQLLRKVNGDASVELTWIVAGKDTVLLKVGSPSCGFDEVKVPLD